MKTQNNETETSFGDGFDAGLLVDAIKTRRIETETPGKLTKRRVSTAFVALMFAAFLIRGAILFSSLNTLNDDPDDYRQLAENWYSTGIFGTGKTATAFRPPLYPWTLKTLAPLRVPSERPPKLAPFDQGPLENNDATAVKIDETQITGSIQRFFDAKIALSRNASIALWHWILGLATVAVAYRIGRKLGFGERGAAFAAFFVAIDPILLQQSRLVMTETLAAFFAATLVWGTIVGHERRRDGSKVSVLYFGALGAAFGLSTLCRPAFFVFAGLVFLYWLAFETIDRFRSKSEESSKFVVVSFGRVVAFLVGIVAVVSPWAARNYRELGRPILTTTHGGYTLYLANNPEIYAHYQTAPFGSLWNPEEFHRRRTLKYADALKARKIKRNSIEAELFQDQWTRDQANAEISKSPSLFVLATENRIAELWRVRPNDVESLSALEGPLSGSSDATLSRQNGGKTATSAEAHTLALNGVARTAIGVFYSFEWAFAAIGCVAIFAGVRPFLASPWFVGFLLVASVQIPHLLYWTNMRMRAPLEVFLPLLASYGLFQLYRYFTPVASTKTTSKPSGT